MVEIIEHKNFRTGSVCLEVVEVDDEGNVIDVKETTDEMPIGMESVIRDDLEENYDIN